MDPATKTLQFSFIVGRELLQFTPPGSWFRRGLRWRRIYSRPSGNVLGAPAARRTVNPGCTVRATLYSHDCLKETWVFFVTWTLKMSICSILNARCIMNIGNCISKITIGFWPRMFKLLQLLWAENTTGLSNVG